MNKKEWKYWYEQLDRFGLLFGGIFFGALAELTRIRTLGIIIGTAGLTCIAVLMIYIERCIFDEEGVSK